MDMKVHKGDYENFDEEERIQRDKAFGDETPVFMDIPDVLNL